MKPKTSKRRSKVFKKRQPPWKERCAHGWSTWPRAVLRMYSRICSLRSRSRSSRWTSSTSRDSKRSTWATSKSQPLTTFKPSIASSSPQRKEAYNWTYPKSRWSGRTPSTFNSSNLRWSVQQNSKTMWHVCTNLERFLFSMEEWTEVRWTTAISTLDQSLLLQKKALFQNFLINPKTI